MTEHDPKSVSGKKERGMTTAGMSGVINQNVQPHPHMRAAGGTLPPGLPTPVTGGVMDTVAAPLPQMRTATGTESSHHHPQLRGSSEFMDKPPFSSFLYPPPDLQNYRL